MLGAKAKARFTRTRRAAQRGAVLIEFAVTTVALVAITLVGIEIDRMILVYASLANAASEGVRFAAVQTAPDEAAVRAKVKSFASGMNVTRITVTTTYSAGDNGQAAGTPGSKVSVLAVYAYDRWISLFIPSGLNFTARGAGIVTY
jgi:Flp pilus assembly protein TadG